MTERKRMKTLNLVKNTRLLTVLLIALLVGACIDPAGARKVLHSAGYTEIKAEGYSMFVCGQDDFFATKFTAKNPAGKYASGAVCSGLLFKGGTIRH